MNEFEVTYPVEKQPRDVGANLETLVNAVLKAGTTAIYSDPEAERLRELQADFDKTLPLILCDPHQMALEAFNKQQADLAAGKKVVDAFDRDEFKREIFLRVSAARDRLIEITIEARTIAQQGIPKIVSALHRTAQEVEARERADHATYGLDEFRLSFLCLALKDSPRRVQHIIPRGDMPCASPRKFVFGIQL